MAAAAWLRRSHAALPMLALIVLVTFLAVEGKPRKEAKPPSRARRVSSIKTEMEAEMVREQLDIDWIEQVDDEDCKIRAVPGRQVSIFHKGYVHEVRRPEDAELWNGKQVDGNREGEPLNFTLRANHVLRGLDYAIEGMCVGDRIMVVIPPHLAFDDPNLMFKWEDADVERPAPVGSFMRYEIELLAVQRDPAKMEGLWIGLGFAAVFAMSIGLAYLLAMLMDSGPSGKLYDPGEQKKMR